jgi:CheY-like chemotaxis protein
VTAEVPRGKVLIVDDETAVGKTLRLILDRDYDVVLVTSAEEALARLSGKDAEDFDVILCDLVMPGMSGVELLHALRAQSEKLAERIIFMTGGLASGVGQNAARLPNVLLEKPFDLERLQRALKEAVLARTG